MLALLFATSILGVAVTGRTVSAAETTVVILGVVDLLIALGLLERFAVGAREFATGLGRVVWTIVCAGLVGFLTLSMFGMTVMALDR